MCKTSMCFVAVAVVWCLAPVVMAAETKVVEFPDPANFYGNATFDHDGMVGYAVSMDEDALWSFSAIAGTLIDPDGLPLPYPATASDAYIFAGDRLVIPGWFPDQGLFVADISDPAKLTAVGVINLPPTANIQGQEVWIDANGYVGYAASFPDDTLYSFNVDTLTLEDPDGVRLPANPDRTVLAGDRVAMCDTTNGHIMVADVSDPRNLQYVGSIDLPGANTFNSNDNIAVADDGRTCFVSTNEKRLFSFDVQTMQVLDPDGLAFGSGSFAEYVTVHGDTIAATSSRGLSFIDASDPADLRLICNANFGQSVSIHPNATVAFTRDGLSAATSIIWPSNAVYTFEVATGQQVSPPVAVDDYPAYLAVLGSTDQVGVMCAGANDGNIWLIDGLFGLILGDLNCDNGVDFGDINPFVLALTNPAGYAAAYPDCDIATADINGDGIANFGDINPFVRLLVE